MGILFDVWMLPILFILHDFEEMIFMPLWKKRYRQKLVTFKKSFFGSVTQGSAFAVGVLEEFVILLFISGLCQMPSSHLRITWKKSPKQGLKRSSSRVDQSVTKSQSKLLINMV